MAAVVPWLTKIGVALGFTGTTATVVGSITVASTALSVYSSVAAMRQLKGLKTAESSSGRDITTRSTVEAVKTVYGTALCSGPVTFVHAADGVLYEQIALTAHEVESITDVYFPMKKYRPPTSTVSAMSRAERSDRTPMETRSPPSNDT